MALAQRFGYSQRQRKSEEAQSHSGLAHTLGHIDCPACFGANMQLIALDSDFSRLPFSRASEGWIDLRKSGHFKPGTIDTDGQFVRALNRFFGALRLCDITAGHIRSYQLARAQNAGNAWKRPAANSKINHEISCLARILKHSNLWAKIQSYYFPLPVASWSPRGVLSEEDEQELFQHAASDPQAQLAYWVACITNNTTAVGCELRGLRLKHVFLREGKEISEIYVPADAVKNSSRPRKIALNRTARWAVEQCYKRALHLGACEPDHYLFPFREKRGVYDPKRPAGKTFLRKSWAKLREVSGQATITPYTFRHQCITRLLENGVQPETVRAIAGHVTPQMMEYYSHQRCETKYAAVMAIELDEIKRSRQGPQPVRRSA